MDTEVLDSIPDCKKCPKWMDPPGVCIRGDKECPEGVRRPQQDTADTEYEVLG